MLSRIFSLEEGSSGGLDLTEDESIARLTFNRPPRNFMSIATITELGDRLRELGERTDISVVVFTGDVPGYFVAHADLDDLGRGEPVDGDPRADQRLGLQPHHPG